MLKLNPKTLQNRWQGRVLMLLVCGSTVAAWLTGTWAAEPRPVNGQGASPMPPHTQGALLPPRQLPASQGMPYGQVYPPVNGNQIAPGGGFGGGYPAPGAPLMGGIPMAGVSATSYPPGIAPRPEGYVTQGGVAQPGEMFPEGPVIGGDSSDEPWCEEGEIGSLWSGWGKLPRLIDHEFLRFEYLNWGATRPGGVILGAPTAGTRQRDALFDLDTGEQVRVPNLHDFKLRWAGGIRATAGFDFADEGGFEVSAFVLERWKHDNVVWDATQGPALGIPIWIDLTNPIPDAFLVNRISYDAHYRAQLWGGEANFLFDYDRDGLLQFRPILGARYVNLRQKLAQRYTTFEYDDTNAAIGTFQRLIDSETYNILSGPQFGLRAEAVTEWITIGVETKIGLMANAARAVVRSQGILGPDDPALITRSNWLQFSPLVDASVYGNIPITSRFTIRIGYNFLFLGRITRPEDNILYDIATDGGLNSFNDFTLRARKQDIKFQGISAGCEFRY